jgi:hypothetical protein
MVILLEGPPGEAQPGTEISRVRVPPAREPKMRWHVVIAVWIG